MSKKPTDMGSRTPISVAVVTAQPMLAMQIQDAVSGHPDVDLQLVTPRAADLTAFAARDGLDIILCEAFDATDIHGLLHPAQHMLILGQDTTPRTLLRDLLSNLRGSDPPQSHTLRGGEEQRRRGEVGISRRRLVAWLLRQQRTDKPGATDTVNATDRAEWVLHSLPHFGSPTTLIFLGTERIQASNDDRIPERLRTALRDEDAILRLDDTTLVVLIARVEPTSTSSLLTRISWRLWPADPLAVTARSAEWQPGQDIAEVIAAGRHALFTAPGPRQRTGALSETRMSSRRSPRRPVVSAMPTQRSVLTFADPWARRLAIEPWCPSLPAFAGEQELRQAVEAQEVEEFGHQGHGLGVARVCQGLADAMGFSFDQQEELRIAALLHDAGKLVLDRALWGGHGTIAAWQRKLMEAHASLGSALADQVGVTDAVALAILHHHERWDGQGYPAHLAEHAIPEFARILFVAEVVDSMLRASYRRPPVNPRQVAAVLEAGAGRLWDPCVARQAACVVRGTI